jgi:hypothetical protein
MKLKTPIEITGKTFNDLNFVKQKMLFNTNRFFIITSFIVETKTIEKEVKNWFRKSRVITEDIFLLTDIEFWSYNSDDEYWGTLTDSGVDSMLKWYDLRKMRRNYEKNIKLPLEKLGFKIQKNEK